MRDKDETWSSPSGYDNDYRSPRSYPAVVVPYEKESPQAAGRRRESGILKRLGAKAHPGSGSGKISFDGSTSEEIIEVKTAEKVFSLQAAYIKRLFNTAVRQGKQPKLVLQFPEYEITMVITRRVN